MSGFPPKAADAPQEATDGRETAPESNPGLDGHEGAPRPADGSSEPPKPEHAPTATEDHAKALEARVAELEAELEGRRQADTLRALKERYHGVPAHVVDHLAGSVPAEALEASVRATAEAMEQSRAGSTGGGGLGGSPTKPGGFAGLFRNRDRAKQSRPFTV